MHDPNTVHNAGLVHGYVCWDSVLSGHEKPVATSRRSYCLCEAPSSLEELQQPLFEKDKKVRLYHDV